MSKKTRTVSNKAGKLMKCDMDKELKEMSALIKKIEDEICSLEETVKQQDSIILKQRKIIMLQTEVLTKVAYTCTDNALVKAIKELNDEKQKIIKEV